MPLARLRPLWIALSVFGLILSPGAALARDNDKPVDVVPEGVELLPGLTYRTVDKVDLKLDMARPKQGVGPFPAVLIFNGGSWMDLFGGRTLCRPMLLQLAERGFVAVAVTHRNGGKNPLPAPLHDARAAVCWLRTNAQKYQIDADRIGAVGYSSGGHLACLLGSTTPADGLHENGADYDVSSRVQVVVACYAPADLVSLHQRLRAGKPSWLLSKTALGILTRVIPNEKDLAKFSPITYARRETAPTLLIHGGRDDHVPIDQSESYERRLKEVEARVQLLKLPEAGHAFGSGAGGADGKKADDATLAFLDEQFALINRDSSKISNDPPLPERLEWKTVGWWAALAAVAVGLAGSIMARRLRRRPPDSLPGAAT